MLYIECISGAAEGGVECLNLKVKRSKKIRWIDAKEKGGMFFQNVRSHLPVDTKLTFESLPVT